MGIESGKAIYQENMENKITTLRAQLEAAKARITELTQGDPGWYDMSEADAFRLWKKDRDELTQARADLKVLAEFALKVGNTNCDFPACVIARRVLAENK